MDRTKGFVNLNRFKSARSLKRLNRVVYDRRSKGGVKKGDKK